MTRQELERWAARLHTAAKVAAIVGSIAAVVIAFVLAPQRCSLGSAGFLCVRSPLAVALVGAALLAGVVVVTVTWRALARVMEALAVTLPEARRRAPAPTPRLATADLPPPIETERGWYVDPRSDRFERRWDGHRWTEDRRPVDT